MTSATPESYHKVGTILAKLLVEHGEGFSETLEPQATGKQQPFPIPGNPNHALELCAGYVAEVSAGRDEAEAKRAAEADYHDRGLTTDFEAAWIRASELVNKYADVVEKVAKQYQRETLTDTNLTESIDGAIGERP